MNMAAIRPQLRVIARIPEKDPLLEKIIEYPEAAMARGRVLKHDQTTTVTVVGDSCNRWIIKRYNTKNPWHAVRRLFSTNRASNCWRAAAWLGAAGIDTARPVAAMEERYLKFLRGRSYFICEFIDGETLDGLISRQDEDSKRYIERACAIVQELGKHGIVHGDLKSTNFIVNGDRIALVDLDAMRRASGPPLAAGVEKDRRRFLRNWVDLPRLMEQFEQRLPPGGGPN